MSRWDSTGGSWESHEYAQDTRHSHSHRNPSISETEDDSPGSLETFSHPSPSILSFGLVESETNEHEIIKLERPWLCKRHLTNGNPSPTQARHNQFHQWRLQDKLKTGNGAIVVCLNLDVDPPDVVKTQPCAVLEGWIDPRKLGSAKALEAIGKNLCQQFQSLNTRIKYKPFLDPSIDEARKFCVNLRKAAKDERLCFYYNGHGVPKPTSSGELWVFNRTYSQYIPVSLYDLQTWLGSPVVYVWDCSAAGNLVQNFQKYAKKRDEETIARHGGNVDGSPLHSQAIQLAACLSNETLPMAPDMPADMFTSCLTSPIEMALRFFFLHQKQAPAGVTLEMLHEVPGDLKDRRTPLGELNWIFTAVTDTIAWTSFSRPIFKRLFRQDLLVAALFRNFLLAERVMRNYHCTPHTVPSLPSTATHPLWAAWDRSLEDILKQLPELIKSGKPPKQETMELIEGRQFVPTPYKYEYKSSSFFTDHLTAFEHWMTRGGGALTKVGPWSMPPLEDLEEESTANNEQISQPDLVPRRPPAQLPVLLQVLLSQAHRMRALALLCEFVDLGPWAVYLVLEIGIYPYVQKLLLSPQADLKPLLVFIWSRLIAFDRTCQADLLREMQFTYFAAMLDYSNPTGVANTSEQRAMCAFILASLCRDHPPGQAACLTWNNGALLDFFLYYITSSDDFLLKQWCCLAIAQMWDDKDDAKYFAAQQQLPNSLLMLLAEDASSEVRAAATYALAIFCGASGSGNNEGTRLGGTGRMPHLSEREHFDLELGYAAQAIKTGKVDASPIVRKEVVVLISALVNEWRGYFTVAAWIYWEEARRSKPTKTTEVNVPEDVAESALKAWVSSLDCSSEMKKVHRSYINQIFSILTSLYELGIDPHLEVSTMASTVVDFIVAMLFESPFSRIQGTTVRGTPTLLSSRARRPSSSTLGSGTISRQPSMSNMAVPLNLNTAVPPLARTESESQIPTRSSFPGLMRSSSIASALGSLAGLALGTQSTANTAPPSPSLSQHSDVELPPTPALNLAQYQSPYPLYSSPEASIIATTSSSHRPSRSASPVLNGHPSSQQESLPITNRYTPANIISVLIVKDLMQFSRRRLLPDQPIPGNQPSLWHDLRIDESHLDRLSDLGLDLGVGLNQTLPLKSRLYDWCLEYYKEPQMRNLDEDEPGSLPYTRYLWRQNRDADLMRTFDIHSQLATKRPWTHVWSSWQLPFTAMRMAFHRFDNHVAISDEGSHVSIYDWRKTTKINSFNNGNPKGTSITSLHFVNEESGGALLTGSSDGVIRVYNNHDPSCSDGKPIQLVSGFRALTTMSQATRGVGIVTEWNQPLTRLLCGGDSEYIYDWDAAKEICVRSMATEEGCPLTSMTSNPHSNRTFIAGFGNGAIKVFDTRARPPKTGCIQNRREHRSWIANVRYQSGGGRQLLSASMDGFVNLWDLRYMTDPIVKSWEVYPDGLASFDVHPLANVFVGASSLSRSWRNQSVVVRNFPSAEELADMREGGHDATLDNPVPLLTASFPTGLTAPSRSHTSSSNIHFTHGCLAFHPTESLFALVTPDGMIRLQGCQFGRGKSQHIKEVETKRPDSVVSNGHHHSAPTSYFESSKSQIDFPTMR